ncbi:hypothetical protein WA026_009263 [Henosepilachna vigintioctopunctata]|uniref:Uncharacterized protein n=1 Tax=Henosepilachna vigintioctopunctata TaxID=420089 RepID=A0AAW1UN76_9CUCU
MFGNELVGNDNVIVDFHKQKGPFFIVYDHLKNKLLSLLFEAYSFMLHLPEAFVANISAVTGLPKIISKTVSINYTTSNLTSIFTAKNLCDRVVAEEIAAPVSYAC